MMYDISPKIGPELKVWPGDTAPAREVLRDLADGDNLTLSTLRSTVHLGAHADAPSHYDAGGATIDARPLEPYLGRCRVIRLKTASGRPVTPDILSAPLDAQRILVDTGTFPDPADFRHDFSAMTPATIDHLAGAGVILIGTDAPSLDPFDSRDLPAHLACLRHDLSILEGLVLKDVPEGIYELIALPLPLVGFDASPVRAVLRPLGS